MRNFNRNSKHARGNYETARCKRVEEEGLFQDADSSTVFVDESEEPRDEVRSSHAPMLILQDASYASSRTVVAKKKPRQEHAMKKVKQRPMMYDFSDNLNKLKLMKTKKSSTTSTSGQQVVSNAVGLKVVSAATTSGTQWRNLGTKAITSVQSSESFRL